MSIFPGVPFVESPLFEAEIGASNLGEAERDLAIRLHRDGYAVIDFPDPQIHARIDRIKERLTPFFWLVADGETAVTCNETRVQDAWRHDQDVREIAANQAVLELLTRLYGRRAFPFQTLNFPVGTQQPLHTDAVHFSSVPERFMCGIWLAMEDITENSGPLTYVAGSHRWPILNNSMIGRRGWGSQLRSAQHPYKAAWQALIAAKKVQPQTFLARKGQALIWCANLLHGGSARLDPRLTRWSQVTHYYFEDCLYYTPAYSDEPLGRLDLRRIVDVSSGAEVPNLYLGEKLHRRAGLARTWRARVRNAWRSLLS